MPQSTSSSYKELLKAGMIPGTIGISISSLMEEQPELTKLLRPLDPIKTTLSFSGLLAKPELQSNCIRIEALVHLSLICCKGLKPPTKKIIEKAFTLLNMGICGRMEDPAEDVFAALVSTTTNNYRIFQGVWESGSYNLQRVINVVESMPNTGVYAEIKRSTKALLLLSESVAAFMSIERNSIGNGTPSKTIPETTLKSLGNLRRSVSLEINELSTRGVSIIDLEPFLFSPKQTQKLSKEILGHTSLERRPLIQNGKHVHVTLVTAISATIRRYVIEQIISLGMGRVFESELAREYLTHFSQQVKTWGFHHALSNNHPVQNGWHASGLTQIVQGRYLHLVLIIDGLSDFLNAGLLSVNDKPAQITRNIETEAMKAYAAAKNEGDYRGGLTLLVGCGYGRCFFSVKPKQPHPSWKIEYISAADLQTLIWTNKCTPLSLWRLLDDLDALDAMNIHFSSLHDLLDLYAWRQHNSGYLVPHNFIPDTNDHENDLNLHIMLDISIKRDLRHQVLVMLDAHRIMNPQGRYPFIRKKGKSIFEHDNVNRTYISMDDLNNRTLRAVYLSSKRNWWCEINVPPETNRGSEYQHWEMLYEWMERAIPVLESEVSNIPSPQITWKTVFKSLDDEQLEKIASPKIEDLEELITTSVDHAHNLVTVIIPLEFMTAFRLPENHAEKIIIKNFICGILILAENSEIDCKSKKILDTIVPNTESRKLHYFTANSFRDYIKEFLPKPILMEESDDDAVKIGLGWRVRSRSDGNVIQGIIQCTRYLNRLVEDTESRICDTLHHFNRRIMIPILLENIESIASDRERWHRSSHALLGLYNDKDDVLLKIANQDHKNNGAELASRILVEIGLCECPLADGMKPGLLDIARLQALAMMIFYLGGWSDAIHRGAIEPHIEITPLGDVQVNPNFMDSVIVPFGQVGSDLRIKDSVQTYEKNYQQIKAVPSVADVFENDFLHAWNEEIGESLDNTRIFLDTIESITFQQSKIIIQCNHTELLSAITANSSLAASTAKNILDAFTLAPRNRWKDIPQNYKDSDRQPWRFRRRLSLIRRPFIQIDQGTNPTIICSPGLARQSIIDYVLRNYYECSFPEFQVKSKSMLKLFGRTKHNRGIRFNSEVKSRLKELGWEAISEVNMTHLLGMNFKRNYGDVDVLAWNHLKQRAIMIECKDLQFHKTLGEIAEQLSDFKGETKEDGKPDLLKKHIDRIELAQQFKDRVSKFVKIPLPLSIEGLLVFKNPVPMQFAWDNMKERILLCLFDELGSLL